jgi:hypothetical protein
LPAVLPELLPLLLLELLVAGLLLAAEPASRCGGR